MALWHARRYPAWFTADTAAALGVALQGVTVTLAAYALSGSVALSGWLATGCMVAHQIVAVFGGTFVDRHNRRTLMIVDAAIGVVFWALIALLLVFNAMTFQLFAGLLVVSYAAHGLLSEASDAMLRSIISAQDYPKASSINQGRDAAVQMVGSPAGGALYAVAPWLPFLVSVALYAVSGAAALRLDRRSGQPGRKHQEERFRWTTTDGKVEGTGNDAGGRCDGSEGDVGVGAMPVDEEALTPESMELRTSGVEVPDASATAGFLEDFLAGWTWALGRKRLVTLVVVAALVNFAMNVVLQGVQLQLVASGVSGARIGLLDTGMCAAMLAGAVVSSQLAGHVHVSATMCGTMALYALMLTPMLFFQNYWVLLVCFSISVLPLPLLNASLQGFIFAKTPTRLQGRVSVATMVPAMALSMFSGATAGSLLPTVGFKALVGAMMVVMALAITVMIVSPTARSIPDASRWEEVEL